MDCQDASVEPTTLFRNERYWIVSKAPGTHFDEALPLSVREIWKPVHRLDQLTSGCLVHASPTAFEETLSLFKDPSATMRKIYVAGASHALSGKPGLRRIEGFIGSRYRSSKKVRFAPIEQPFRNWHSCRPIMHDVVEAPEGSAPAFRGQLYEVRLYTGARHQIRAAFAADNAPLVGDELYGGPSGPRLELHCREIEFTDPSDSSIVKAECKAC